MTNVRVTYADGHVEDIISLDAEVALEVFTTYQHEVDHPDPEEGPRVRRVAYVNTG